MALFNKNPNEVAYTGDMELNIELHNICEEDLTKLRSRLVEVKGCAYWE